MPIHAVSLTRTDPDDLDPLRQVVGNAIVVGLGESAHGTREQFTLNPTADTNGGESR